MPIILVERDLINSARIFKANAGANGQTVSFADACKVVILAKILEVTGTRDELTPKEMELVLKLIRGKESWYKFW